MQFGECCVGGGSCVFVMFVPVLLKFLCAVEDGTGALWADVDVGFVTYIQVS